MGKNNNLLKAQKNKNDEFYTCLEDINAEMKYYEQHFKGKTIYMNCDNPTWSNFWRYFHIEFERLGLKKIIATHYDKNEPTYKMEYTGGDDNDIKVGVKTPLDGNGDFRNQECLDLLDEANIVVTNPPFSLFREYVATLMKYDKLFLIIGSQNAITYKEFFPFLKDNKIWLGNNHVKTFLQPNGKYKQFGNICWYTNLDINKKHEEIILYKTYNKIEYPKYDNYDAINVDKVAEIPMDYEGVMGVPITFMDKYNPKQFEIIGIACGNSWANYTDTLKSLNFNPNIKYGGGLGCGVVNGKCVYARILIRKRT